METPKTALLGRTLDEIQQIVRNLGMPKFAAKQITSWLYDKKVETIDEMTNLSLKHREALKEGYEVGASAPVEEMRSVDGTVKYLSAHRPLTLLRLFIYLMRTVPHFAFPRKWDVR